MENKSSSSGLKNGSVNERPLFMQNGNRRFSLSTADTQEISNFRRALPQFLAVSVKNILLFVYGMTLGFPTIVIPAIQGGEGREPSDIVLNKDEISWFSSINLICVPLGCLFSGALTQPIGKRRAMQFVNLPILASWLLFHFSTKTEHLYAALCLSGLGGGLMEAPVLTYVAEITEPKYRGILSALGSTCVITGVFIQFIMGSIMDWRTIAAVSSVFPVICIIALCFIPESPTWLIREERFREAVKSLQWLRGWVPEHKIEEEFNRLYDELITQPALEEQAEQARSPDKKPSCLRHLRMFRKRSFVVPFMLVSFTFFVGHFSGKTSLQTYAVQIFHTLKAPINKYHATILLGVAEMIATVLCVFLIHFTGKRPLVMISTMGMFICLFGTATYAHYLQVVPGFAVNNVVVNASSIVPTNSIISQDNITRIFETEGKALLIKSPLDAQEYSANVKNNQNNSRVKRNKYTFSAPTLAPLIHRGVTDELKQTKNYDTTPPIFDLDKSTEKYTEATTDSTILSSTAAATEKQSEMTQKVDSEILSTAAATEKQPELTQKVDSTTMSTAATIEKQLELTQKEDSMIISTAAVTEKQSGLPQKVDSKILSTAADSEKQPALTQNVAEEILLSVPKQETNKLVWIPLILLLSAAFFAHLGIRMIPWILIGEVFPAPVRSTASGLAGGLGYIFGFLANKLFLQMLAVLTLPGTFWLYSCVALLGFVTLYFTLPETEGRTLGEIEAHFSKKSKTNLLSKKQQKLEKEQKLEEKQKGRITGPLENLENLHIPIGPYTEAKIIQLQQSDFIPIQINGSGATNMAFEENHTTHL